MDEKVAYLYNLVKAHENSKFEEVRPPDITAHLTMMLTEPDVVEDPYDSQTVQSQLEVENSIKRIYKGLQHHNGLFEIEHHTAYVTSSLAQPLPHYYKSLDANHSWMLYWLLNSYCLMNADLDAETVRLAREKIATLIVDDGFGGMSGGSGQLGHVASTYAGVLTLVLLKDYETLGKIRKNLYGWFMALKRPDGSFIMHVNGESDTRSTYCVLVVASLLGLLTDELCENTLSWILRCQTYEGGFAGVPHTEAHGGYTFCAVAAVVLLAKEKKDVEKINLPKLIRWCVARQYQLEGGLSGRTNKLVDACYSFWVGAVYAIIESVLEKPIFDKEALKTYLLNCCQRDDQGGFRDKPGKSVDFYHTNYSLLGLSVCEHSFRIAANQDLAYNFTTTETGEDTNIQAINPIFGLPVTFAENCSKFFK